MQHSTTYPSQQKQGAASFLVESEAAPVYQTGSADTHDGVGAQAILLARLYWEYTITMSIQVLSVVMSLGASCVMYYYISAGGKHGRIFQQ